MTRSILVTTLALAVAGVACKSEQTTTGTCTADDQCAVPGTRCDSVTKRCVCAIDEACDVGFFCNSAGVCQEIAGCATNLDCREGTYCDVASGQCLQGPATMLGSACGLASHCPYGTVCRDGACTDGCFDDGDCVLGQLCIDGFCATGSNLCASDAFCEYGARCDDATTPAQCKEDRRGPYCRGCTFRTSMNPEPCDHPRNFCLINSLETGGFSQFCGVDCSLGQTCPNGYECHGVVILTQDECRSTAECRCDPSQIRFAEATCTLPSACDPRLPNGQPDPDATGCTITGHAACNGGVEGGAAACVVAKGLTEGSCTCATNEDCAEGGTCVAGLCCGGSVREDRDCVGGENRVSGFCTCATDQDCPRDVCDGSRGACAITGLPCTPGQDDCGPIPCVDGGCVIGQNCAPVEGLSCSVVSGR
ncbi:hypothetical protein L6R52_34845 [Myxococcota bacterium]|nr:hypothetical protein [Myxococcota bacterium]